MRMQVRASSGDHRAGTLMQAWQRVVFKVWVIG